jgi:hypothetical protein
MMKLQSSAGHKWIGKTLAKDKKTGIHERADLDDPCIVVYGTSVPGKFYQAIDYNNIEDGFLPRFLVFESDDPFPLTNYDRKSPEVPDHIIEHVKQWEDEFQAGYFDKILSEPRKVRHTDETLLIMREFEKKVQKEYKQERLNKCHPVWGRAQAMAEQLALLFTCSGNPATNRICPVSARKACALAAVLCTQQVARIKGNVSSNEYEADVLKIMKSISESAHEGISKRDLVRKHQSIQSKRLLDILSMLQQSEKVVCCKKATIRKPKMMYYSSEYVEIEEE